MAEYAEFTGTEEEAENFLNANRELAKTWILKHVPRKTLEAWVIEKRLTVRGNESQSVYIHENLKSRGESSVGGNLVEQARDCFAYGFLLASYICNFVSKMHRL